MSNNWIIPIIESLEPSNVDWFVTTSQACLNSENKCTKNFPKKFEYETKTNLDGYPSYQSLPGITAM
ncbi:hypothetical protein BB558_006978, partial [Smittium angustum]